MPQPQFGYVLSLNARGIPTFHWRGVSNCGAVVARCWRNLLDIGLSWLVFLRLLNSNSLLSLALVFFSTLFYYVVLDQVKYLDNVWTIYCFLIVLPILILVVMVYGRREAALKQTAKVKSLILALFHLHRDAGMVGEMPNEVLAPKMRALLHSLLDHMQVYFNHARSTATHFFWPYGPMEPLPGSELSNEAITIHILHSAVLRDFKRLSVASQGLRVVGAGEAALLQHGVLVQKLHTAFQKMSLLKEMRTPLVLRACCLFYSTVILPLLLGPFWSFMGRSMTLPFAEVVALLTHSVILGLLNLTVMYEDPFDDKVMSQSVDNISLIELADTCKWLMEDESNDQTFFGGATAPGTDPLRHSYNSTPAPPPLPHISQAPIGPPPAIHLPGQHGDQNIGQTGGLHGGQNIPQSGGLNKGQNEGLNMAQNGGQGMVGSNGAFVSMGPAGGMQNGGLIGMGVQTGQGQNGALNVGQNGAPVVRQSAAYSGGSAIPLVQTVTPRQAMANGNAMPQLQFTHPGNNALWSSFQRGAGQLLRSPGSVASPPMPPIIGSTQIPDGTKDYEA